MKYRIIKAMWGKSTDNSVAGLILAENSAHEIHWYFGARKHYTNEKRDIEHIIKYGTKLSMDFLEHKVKIDLS